MQRASDADSCVTESSGFQQHAASNGFDAFRQPERIALLAHPDQEQRDLEHVLRAYCSTREWAPGSRE